MAFHVLALPVLLGLAVTATAGGASGRLLLRWTAGYLLLTVLLETAVRWADWRDRRVVTGGDHDSVVRRLGGTGSLLETADVIDILSGTLKTFTEQAADIRALHDRYRANVPVRILMLAPGSDGARQAAGERRARGGVRTNEAIDQHVFESLQRLAEEFPLAVLQQIVRLYPTGRHKSVHRYGDRYVVTVYTFGRGGSSPAFALRRPGHEQFCAHLDRGFSELWNSPTTEPLSDVVLAQIRGTQLEAAAASVGDDGH